MKAFILFSSMQCLMQKFVVLVAWRSSCKKKVEQWTWYLKPNLFLSRSLSKQHLSWLDLSLTWWKITLNFLPDIFLRTRWVTARPEVFFFRITCQLQEFSIVWPTTVYGEKLQGTTSLFIWQTSNSQLTIDLASDRKNRLHEENLFSLCFFIDICDLSR